ncbi:hypothetical protein EJ08DRAFT_712181 [Tothia fuscella]|uniref:RING-type domain-containing protein n=1 Tax=Tothia fuscella TaxID=1048955 RepID=A0A9P4NVB2_9PEZI|nr:hypothetical protein EJ08DRAFT_712181 [Tothia fuscella]
MGFSRPSHPLYSQRMSANADQRHYEDTIRRNQVSLLNEGLAGLRKKEYEEEMEMEKSLVAKEGVWSSICGWTRLYTKGTKGRTGGNSDIAFEIDFQEQQNITLNISTLNNNSNTVSTVAMSLPTREEFMEFLQNAPTINVPRDLNECGICHQEYFDTPNDRPIRLPCGHVFGSECLISWLDTVTSNQYINTCPYRCRLYEATNLPGQDRPLFALWATPPSPTDTRQHILHIQPAEDDPEAIIVVQRDEHSIVVQVGSRWLVAPENAALATQQALHNNFVAPEGFPALELAGVNNAAAAAVAIIATIHAFLDPRRFWPGPGAPIIQPVDEVPPPVLEILLPDIYSPPPVVEIPPPDSDSTDESNDQILEAEQNIAEQQQPLSQRELRLRRRFRRREALIQRELQRGHAADAANGREVGRRRRRGPALRRHSA